jgi:hypothetical protein
MRRIGALLAEIWLIVCMFGGMWQWQKKKKWQWLGGSGCGSGEEVAVAGVVV